MNVGWQRPGLPLVPAAQAEVTGFCTGLSPARLQLLENRDHFLLVYLFMLKCDWHPAKACGEDAPHK